MRVYIIAEAGVNHNGDFGTACRLIEAAKTAGADCVKFQTFRASNVASVFAKKADYQSVSVPSGASQLEMLRKLELSYQQFLDLKDYCNRIGIDFVSTPFDLESITFLAALDMPFWKIPSGEVTNLPYLLAVAETNRPVVMSTGMCKLDEIQTAVNVLKGGGAGDIILLHCNTEYPTPYEDVNLSAMKTLRETLHCPVGYSDHTVGIEVPVAAAALGAVIIEKHFTLDRNMEGPDHRSSLEPGELATMTAAIRHIEQAIGDGVKTPSPSERKNIAAVRKSIVARHPILKGEVLTEENLTVKRPGTGISPMRWFEVLGSRASRNFEEDELIE